MKRLKTLVLALLIGIGPLARAHTGISVGIALPGIKIGINQPAYPRLMRVPGYSPRGELSWRTLARGGGAAPAERSA